MTNTIGRMSPAGQWTKAGYLNRGRDRCTAIYDGEYLMIIGGGVGFVPTEKCSIKSTSVSCVSQNPELYQYQGPEAFLIAESFCEV